MQYFPLFLKLDGTRQVVIIGGGDIARSKAETLLSHAAALRVVARSFSPACIALLQAHHIPYEEAHYDAQHLEGAALVIAATNDPQVNARIQADAVARGVLVNVVDQPDSSDVIFPAIVRRGPLQIAISSAGISPVMARMIKQKIERLLPWNLEALMQFIAQRRMQVKQALSGIQAKRLFWQEIVEGPVAEEVFEGNLNRAGRLFDEALNHHTSTTSHAALYLVGAGPGHPELITLKAIRLLGKADVVLYDRLVAPLLLEQYARREAEKICVGKTRDLHAHSQESIDALIEQHLRAGHVVVRLKGGDPGIYAHGAEEIAIARRLGVPYQIVPGISAANGCAATAGIPLTERGGAHAVRFLTLYKETLQDADFWTSIAHARNETLVFYMTTQYRAALCDKLMESGLPAETPILAIEQGTTPYHRESEATIGTFAKKYATHTFLSPTLMIVGDVVRWRKDHSWKEQAADIFSFFPALAEGTTHVIH